MAVMARDVWTDERLDELNQRVDEGFKETREEFKAVQAEMREEFNVVRSEMRSEFKAMRTEMGEVRSEVNALARVIMQLAFGLIGTMLVGFLGIMTTLIVKL
jgi:uncharacterized coiled-coil DUF342 family protein